MLVCGCSTENPKVGDRYREMQAVVLRVIVIRETRANTAIREGGREGVQGRMGQAEGWRERERQREGRAEGGRYDVRYS